MATTVSEKWLDLKYSDSFGQITVQRTYVLSHTVGGTPDTTQLPAINSYDAVWTAAKCISREMRQVGPAQYECFCTFQAEYGFGVDPTTLPTKWNINIGQQSVRINSDKDENIIKNSCGDPYDGISGSIPVVVISATKYYSTLMLSTLLTVENKVNNATWNPSGGLMNTGARKALCSGVVVGDFDQNSTYFQMSFRFELKSAKTGSPEGHKLRIIDEGKSYFADAGGTQRVSPIDQDGLPIAGPVLLNGKGRKAGQVGGIALPAGATFTQINNSNYLDYDVKEEYDFSGLNL